MCGISGIFDLSGTPIDASLLSRMTLTMAHRGPDGTGQFIDGEVGLGHRRLSIIDVEGGDQPIGNEDRSIQVVFNGEIYNFLELRDELERMGHVFRTRTDTEVIVHAYEEWGRDCVKQFNGMFAFALWDCRARVVFIGRDHLGIKPLYYVNNGRQVFFASEIKSLLATGMIEREVDVGALAELFTFRYVPSPKTLFKGIMKLPPAHTLVLSRHGMKTERFWSSIPTAQNGCDEPEQIEKYQHLLEDAVRLQLRSDVPVGLFLSSGVDSGMLLAIMSGACTTPVQTFTIGFEGGEKTNEVTEAREMAKRFGANHHTQILTPDDYARFYERYMGDIEEPVGNETAAAFYFVSKLTSSKVKVALSGQGADEPWAGYFRYKGIRLSELYSRIPRPITRTFAAAIKSLPGRMERLKRGVESLDEPDMLTRLTRVYSFFSSDMKRDLYAGALRECFSGDAVGPRVALHRLHSDVKHLDPLAQMLYIDTRSNLPDDLLMVGDKTSMACSLESRVPFLDYRLVEFIESLPNNLKLRRLSGKYLHKKAALKWLPREIVYRKKKGFANPVQYWFRKDMKAFVHDHLLGPNSGIAEFFNQNAIARILQLDCDGSEQYQRHIYLLLSFELGHRRFVTGRSDAKS